MHGPDPRILIISYLFPPAGGITVQRALSFAKYLPQSDFQVHVLTAKNPGAPVQDPDLLKHVPPQVTIHRAWTPEVPFHVKKKLWSLISPGGGGEEKPAAAPKPASGGLKSRLSGAIRRALCPDPQVVWVPFAIRNAAAAIRKHGIDTVLVTAPPFSAFLIGNAVKRRFPHIKLISDFRDEWLRFYLTDFDFLNDDYIRRRAEAIERATIETSDLVVAVTRSSLSEIRSRYPQQPDRKFAWIPNGYDPEMFQDFQTKKHGSSKVVVTHVGTAYKTASPRYYLDALDSLPEHIRSRFETRFVGRIAETETALFRDRKSRVELVGLLPQAKALRHIEETDYLLLTMTNDFSLPGKLFEYLATGKRIIALSPPDGEVGKILRETGAGWCVDHEDAAAVRNMLITAAEAAGGDAAARPDFDLIRRYERPRLAAELAETIRTRLA